MADSGDAVNSTSSGKEARNTVIDGPVTDPASNTKVNQRKPTVRYCDGQIYSNSGLSACARARKLDSV